MRDDDDPLAAYDLDAWRAPRAPNSIADAVMRRMQEPPRAAAVEISAPARRRRWWIAAAAVVAAAAVALLIIVTRGESAAPPAAPAVSPPPPAPAPAPAPAPCDADAPADEATTAMSKGDYAGALAGFERSLACKHDPALVPSAFVAACGAKNVARAKVHWKQLPASRQSLLQRCLDNDLDPRE